MMCARMCVRIQRSWSACHRAIALCGILDIRVSQIVLKYLDGGRYSVEVDVADGDV